MFFFVLCIFCFSFDALAEVVGLVVLAAEDPAPDQPHLGIDRVEDLASERLVVSED